MRLVAYDLNQLITELQIAQKQQESIHIRSSNTSKSWKNNHILCIQNYDKMKESRKRIIQQRDNLRRTIYQMQKRINDLEEYSKLKNENIDLYQTVQSQNAKIVKLENERERLISENFENNRELNLIKSVLNKEIQ